MNTIHGMYSNGLPGPDPVRPQHSASQPPAKPTPQTPGTADQVEISPIAQLLSRAAQLPDIRQEKVELVRQQIAAGVYETPEKLAAAIDRLLEEHSF